MYETAVEQQSSQASHASYVSGAGLRETLGDECVGQIVAEIQATPSDKPPGITFGGIGEGAFSLPTDGEPHRYGTEPVVELT